MGALLGRMGAGVLAVAVAQLAAAAVPVGFPSVELGSSSVQWVELPAPASITGSVTGPFAITLRTRYGYASILGVNFGPTASTTGVCPVPSGTPCALYLGIELLPSAPQGTATGTVTLSNGSTYTLTADVLGAALDIQPTALTLGSIPVGSKSDVTAVTVTNLQSSAIAVGAVSVSGPFTATSSCPVSLAAQTSCSVNVVFVPTATGGANGLAQLSTSQGTVGVALSGTGVANAGDISFSPASLNLPLSASTNDSGNRRITITNLSATATVTIGVPSGNICTGSSSTQCLDFTANTCTTLAVSGNCQFSVHYVGVANEATGIDTVDVPVTVGSTTAHYSIVAQHVMPTATAPTVIGLSTTDLRFPATPFGSASAAQTITVKNASATSLSIVINSIADFVGDPVCGPVLPGASCTLGVHFVPTSGNTQANGVLNFAAYAYPYSGTNDIPIGNAGVLVSGSSISTAAIASPSYPPLVEPLPDTNAWQITNTSSVPLVIAGIYGASDAVFDATECPATLAPDASCSVVLSEVCSVPPCSLVLASNAASSPDTYAVPGENQSLPDDFLSVSGGPIVFMPTAVGATSLTSTILVSLIEELEESSEAFNVFTSKLPDFTINNGCPAVLQPSPAEGAYLAHCYISVQFTPQSAGFKSGTIYWTSQFGSGTILLAGTAAAPAGLTLSPASLFLGAAAGQNATQIVTVTNSSSAAIPLSPLALAGTSATSFAIGSTTCGSSLSAGASCTIAVSYTTPSTYLATASLVVTSGNGVVQTVGLQGVIPSVSFAGTTSGGLPFSEITVGHIQHATAIFQSYDGYPITLTSVSLTGSSGASFSIVSSTCSANFVLQGAASCTVGLEFAPQVAGSLAEALEFKSSVGTNDFDLTAYGGPLPAIISQHSLNFGSQAVGAPSAPLNLTLSNPNAISLDLGGAGMLAGANAGDFAVAGTCAEIAAGGSCTYTATFTPSAVGVRSASLPVNAGLIYTGGSPNPAIATVALIGGGITNGTPGVNLAAAYNVDGIGVDGARVQGNGLDGLGSVYSATLLGSGVYWSGAYITFGSAGAVDAISNSTIALPAGNYVALKLLATAVRSNQPNQTFVVSYTDGTSTSIKQSLSSWTTPQQYSGETIATSMAYRLNPDGTTHAGTYNLYGYSFVLDHTKTLKSLTLPNNREVVVLGVDLRVTNQVPVDLSLTANVSAVHTDGVAVDGAGIDDIGDAYSAQLMGTSLTWAGVTFNLPEALPVDALANTTLALPSGSFSKLALLATGVQGNQLNHSFTVTYTDGTTTTFKQNFSDWHSPQGYPGESNVLIMAYRLNGNGSQHTGTYLLYGYSLPLDSMKTVKSVTLPGVRTVVVLAVTLSP